MIVRQYFGTEKLFRVSCISTSSTTSLMKVRDLIEGSLLQTLIGLRMNLQPVVYSFTSHIYNK